MTTLEKRQKLKEFCSDIESCCDGGCPLHIDKFACGRGTHFMSQTKGKFEMTDKEIDDAYAIVFPSDIEGVELEVAIPDGININISGLDINRLDSITIAFKED